MIYIVALVEYGRVTHRWHYDSPVDATRQLYRLMTAYDEVNDVAPILLKVGSSEIEVRLKDLLSHYVFE